MYSSVFQKQKLSKKEVFHCSYNLRAVEQGPNSPIPEPNTVTYGLNKHLIPNTINTCIQETIFVDLIARIIFKTF